MPRPAFPGLAEARRPVLLLIDDEPMVGRFIGHAAEECGYRAVRTTSAEGFRRAYRDQAPDAVAVDLSIPGCDGIEILRMLAEERCEAPVIVISGLDKRVLDSSLRFGEALGLRMAGLLQKPVLVSQLAGLLPVPAAGSA